MYNKIYNFFAESKFSELCSFNIIIKRFITIFIITNYIITYVKLFNLLR